MVTACSSIAWVLRSHAMRFSSALVIVEPRLYASFEPISNAPTLRGMSGIYILWRLFLALGRHFGGIRSPEDSARPQFFPLDIILGQARFAVVQLPSRAIFQL